MGLYVQPLTHGSDKLFVTIGLITAKFEVTMSDTDPEVKGME
jgi:hypothetical protein